MENALYISFLENRIEELKLLSCDDDCQDTINYCNKLKAENKELESKVSSLAMRLSLKPYSLNKRNEELKAEIRQLKADIKHDAKVCEDYDDGLIAEIKELKADNKRNVDKFEMRVETLKNEVEEGRAENRELKAELKTTKDNGLGILNEMIELKESNRRKEEQVKIGRKRQEECDVLKAERIELIVTIDGLEEDNKRLYQEHKECRDALEEQVGDLMIDKDRLVEQVSSNSHNNSSTHTHTKGGDVMPTIDEVRESCGEIIE